MQWIQAKENTREEKDTTKNYIIIEYNNHTNTRTIQMIFLTLLDALVYIFSGETMEGWHN